MVKRVLRRLRADGRGDDLIEYALLASFVALVGVLGFQLMGSNMNSAFRAWDSNVQNQWEMPDPISSSGP